MSSLFTTSGNQKCPRMAGAVCLVDHRREVRKASGTSGMMIRDMSSSLDTMITMSVLTWTSKRFLFPSAIILKSCNKMRWDTWIKYTSEMSMLDV